MRPSERVSACCIVRVSKASTELAIGVSGKFEFAQRSRSPSAMQLLRWRIGPVRGSAHAASFSYVPLAYFPMAELTMA